jgi:phosphatidylserine decarboxylase
MYHRFHSPHDCRVEQVCYISGDTWNVNPIALKRVEKLFCKNERALVRTKLAATGHVITLVPVAAVLVASIRLHFLDVLLHLKYRGPNLIPCAADFRKGEEMGWFQHGSTIIVFAPRGFTPCAQVREGQRRRMGQGLLHLPP